MLGVLSSYGDCNYHKNISYASQYLHENHIKSFRFKVSRNINLSVFLIHQDDCINLLWGFYEQFINHLWLHKLSCTNKLSIGIFSIAVKLKGISSVTYEKDSTTIWTTIYSKWCDETFNQKLIMRKSVVSFFQKSYIYQYYL